jgi:hypothetical protein
MTKRLMKVAATAALLLPVFAFAQGVVVVNGERGIIFNDTPSTVTRAQVRDEMKAPSVAAGGAVYVGGEAGWALAASKYEFNGGHMVHASDCPMTASMNAPKAKGSSDVSPVYTGA